MTEQYQPAAAIEDALNRAGYAVIYEDADQYGLIYMSTVEPTHLTHVLLVSRSRDGSEWANEHPRLAGLVAEAKEILNHGAWTWHFAAEFPDCPLPYDARLLVRGSVVSQVVFMVPADVAPAVLGSFIEEAIPFVQAYLEPLTANLTTYQIKDYSNPDPRQPHTYHAAPTHYGFQYFRGANSTPLTPDWFSSVLPVPCEIPASTEERTTATDGANDAIHPMSDYAMAQRYDGKGGYGDEQEPLEDDFPVFFSDGFEPTYVRQDVGDGGTCEGCDNLNAYCTCKEATLTAEERDDPAIYNILRDALDLDDDSDEDDEPNWCPICHDYAGDCECDDSEAYERNRRDSLHPLNQADDDDSDIGNSSHESEDYWGESERGG